MKKIAIKLSIALMVSMLFGMVSCTEDNTEPEPTDARANFIGLWLVSEQWTKLSYEVNITKDPTSDNGIYIENFAASGAGVKTHALVSGKNVNISPLPQTLSNGWIIHNGSGTLSGTTKINWSYVFDDEANSYTAIAVYTKQ